MITGSNFAIIKVAFFAVDEQLLLLLHFLNPVLQSYSVQYVQMCNFTSSCDPTTMALLVTDFQRFLCHLELIHNICDSYNGQCPCVNGIWLQPYLDPFQIFFCLIFAFLGLFVINVFHVTVWLQCPKIPEILLSKAFKYLQSCSRGRKDFFFLFFFCMLMAKYDRAVCWHYFNRTKNLTFLTLFQIQWQNSFTYDTIDSKAKCYHLERHIFKSVSELNVKATYRMKWASPPLAVSTA